HETLAVLDSLNRSPTRLRLKHHVGHPVGAFTLPIGLAHSAMNLGRSTVSLECGQATNQFSHLAEERIGCDSHAPSQGRDRNAWVCLENRHASLRKIGQFRTWFQP